MSNTVNMITCFYSMRYGNYNFAIPIGFHVFKCVPTAMILPEFLALIFVFFFFDNKQHQLSKIAQISQHSDIVELTIVPLSSLE